MILYNFHSQIDSIDVSNDYTVIGLSNLEGNVWDSYINICNTNTNQIVEKLHYNTGVTMVRIIKDRSNSFIASFDDGKIAFHSIYNNLSLNQDNHNIIKAHENCVSTIAINPIDNQYFVSGSWDGSIKLWNISDTISNKPLQVVLDAHHKPINEIVYNPYNSNIISSIGQDGFLRIWDTKQSLEEEGCVQIENYMQPISCIAWNIHNEYQIFIGLDNGQILSYDIRYQNNNSYHKNNNINKVHNYRVRKLTCIPKHSNVLLSSSDDCKIAVLNIQDITNNLILPQKPVFDMYNILYIIYIVYIICSIHIFYVYYM